MKTIILRIGKRGEGEDAGYPVTIHCDDSGPDWDSIPLARSVIPEKLDGLVPQRMPGKAGATRDAVLMVARQEVGKQDGGRAFGEALFRLAFRDEIRARWDSLRVKYPAEKPEQRQEGRRVLLDVRDPELRRLPWELLNVPGTPIWLAGDGTNTLARVSPWPDSPGEPAPAEVNDEPPPYLRDASPREADGPLRVLVVIGSKPDDVAVQAELELRSIEKALWGLAATKNSETVARCCRFDLKVIRQPFPVDLAKKYLDYRPHIFHFIGHGSIDNLGTTKLLLSTPMSGTDGKIIGYSVVDYTINMVYQLIGEHAPELAVLNCCHANPEPWQGGVWSIAKVFLDRGARAVLGTLGPVPGKTAAGFAGEFYDKLAEGWPIDEALARARVKVEQDGGASFGTALPYLQLGAAPDRVLSLPLPDRVDRVSRVPDFQDNVKFVNRHEERASLRAAAIAAAIGRAPGAPIPSRVVLLRGNANVGKTSLLRKAMESCALGSRRLKYVRLADQGAVDFLGLVLAIRNRKAVSSAGRTVDAEPNPFDRFDRTITALTTVVKSSSGLDRERRLIDAKADDNANDRIAEQLLEGLKAMASSGGGLILALDQLTDADNQGLMPLEFKSLSIPKLIQPILEGNVPGVTMVIAGGSDELDTLGLSGLDPVPDQFELGPFPDNTFRDYAEEYCRRRRDPWAIADRTIKMFEDLIRGPWSPSVLPNKIGEVNDILKAMQPSSAPTPGGRR